MEITPAHNKKIAKLTFAWVYPHYVAKVERRGRTKEELKPSRKNKVQYNV